MRLVVVKKRIHNLLVRNVLCCVPILYFIVCIMDLWFGINDDSSWWNIVIGIFAVGTCVTIVLLCECKILRNDLVDFSMSKVFITNIFLFSVSVTRISLNYTSFSTFFFQLLIELLSPIVWSISLLFLNYNLYWDFRITIIAVTLILNQFYFFLYYSIGSIMLETQNSSDEVSQTLAIAEFGAIVAESVSVIFFLWSKLRFNSKNHFYQELTLLTVPQEFTQDSIQNIV